jgi:hypothetical protein
VSGQKLEPSNAEIVRYLIEVISKLDLLITSAKEGGGLVPQVSYPSLKKLRKRIKKAGYKIKCKKQCRRGPCRYGASQALQCLESFEKIAKLIKKRKLLAKHIPYTSKQLSEFSRRDLLTLAGVVGVNMRKVLKKKGEGNRPIIDGILRDQDRYIRLVDKARKKKELRDRLRTATIRAQEEVERHQEKIETEIKIDGPQ